MLLHVQHAELESCFQERLGLGRATQAPGRGTAAYRKLNPVTGLPATLRDLLQPDFCT